MYARILVAIDGSDTSRLALDAAIGMARAFGSRIRLVHVVEELSYAMAGDMSGGYTVDFIKAMRDAGARIINEDMARVSAAGIEVDNMLYDQFGERIGETMAKAASQWDADLIVVGTHGRRGMARLFMGSGAEQVIRLAPVPVLVIRARSPAAV